MIPFPRPACQADGEAPGPRGSKLLHTKLNTVTDETTAQVYCGNRLGS